MKIPEKKNNNDNQELLFFSREAQLKKNTFRYKEKWTKWGKYELKWMNMNLKIYI